MIDNLVSVIMCLYNTREEYLREAIESILNQTYANFEFIIIDDGSTNNSVSVVQSYHDKRILLIRKEHSGIPESLNIGLDLAQGEFIARMDSDDVCLPDRFETQVGYLKEHTDCIVCGSYAEFIGDKYSKNKSGKYNSGIPDMEEYRIRLLFSNFPTILHSSAMYNHRIFAAEGLRYDEKYLYAQDYKMWVDCSKVAVCAVCPSYLMKIRLHSSSVTRKQRSVCERYREMVINEQLKSLNLVLPQNWKEVHWGALNHHKTSETEEWLNKIITQNKKYRVYNPELFERLLFSDKYDNNRVNMGGNM